MIYNPAVQQVGQAAAAAPARGVVLGISGGG